MAPVKEAIAQLNDALDNLGDIAVSCLSGPESLEILGGLVVAQTRLSSIWCRALADAGPQTLNQTNTRHRSIATAVAEHTGIDPRPVRRDVRLGVWLADFPIFSCAFSQGRISPRHLHAIRLCDNKRTRPHLPEAQSYLIEAAQNCTWADFITALRYWELGADPDGDEPIEQVRNRRFSFTKRSDGTVTGSFKLDPLSGAAFATAINRASQRMFKQDSQANEARTSSQRQADALVQLVSQGAVVGGASQAPLIHLVLGEDVLDDALSRPHIDDSVALPLHCEIATQRCELIDGTPIHPRFSMALLPGASMKRLVMNADSEIVDLGRSIRLFPERLKQALLIKARGRCQHPGCDSPHSWLQADHLIPWSRGGATRLSNGQILCDPHNKAKSDEPPPWAPTCS